MLYREFEEKGFVLVPDIVTGDECLQIGSALQASGTPGTRSLLTMDWCAALSARIRKHPALLALVLHDYVATQCTSLRFLRYH